MVTVLTSVRPTADRMSADGFWVVETAMTTSWRLSFDVELQNRLDLVAEARIGVFDGGHRSGSTGNLGLTSPNAGLWVVGAPMSALLEPRSPRHDHKNNRQIHQI